MRGPLEVVVEEEEHAGAGHAGECPCRQQQIAHHGGEAEEALDTLACAAGPMGEEPRRWSTGDRGHQGAGVCRMTAYAGREGEVQEEEGVQARHRIPHHPQAAAGVEGDLEAGVEAHGHPSTCHAVEAEGHGRPSRRHGQGGAEVVGARHRPPPPPVPPHPEAQKEASSGEQELAGEHLELGEDPPRVEQAL